MCCIDKSLRDAVGWGSVAWETAIGQPSRSRQKDNSGRFDFIRHFTFFSRDRGVCVVIQVFFFFLSFFLSAAVLGDGGDDDDDVLAGLPAVAE